MECDLAGIAFHVFALPQAELRARTLSKSAATRNAVLPL